MARRRNIAQATIDFVKAKIEQANHEKYYNGRTELDVELLEGWLENLEIAIA